MNAISDQKNIKNTHTQGFTVIEILITVGIMVLLLGATSSLVISLTQARARNQVVAEVEGQGLLAMQMITQIMRNAISINAPATGVSATSSFAVSTAILSPTVFSLTGGTLYMKEGSAAPIPLTSSQVTVSDLSFQNLSRATTPGVVKIQFAVSYARLPTSGAYVYSQTFTDAASLRKLMLK